MSRVLLAIAMIAMSATLAPAEPAPQTPGAHAIYVDLLGRAGLWGADYDYRPRRWLAAGAAASYYSFDGDRFTTLAPYLSL